MRTAKFWNRKSIHNFNEKFHNYLHHLNSLSRLLYTCWTLVLGKNTLLLMLVQNYENQNQVVVVYHTGG